MKVSLLMVLVVEVAMKVSLLMVLTVSLALTSHAAQKKEPKVDQEKIQGTWKVVSFEPGGEKDAAEDIKDLKVEITKDKIVLKEGGKATGESTYKLDPAKKPKWIDVTQIKKDGKPGQKALGIYELAGNDLKLCFAGDSKQKRPTVFQSKRDSNHLVLMVLKREKR